VSRITCPFTSIAVATLNGSGNGYAAIGPSFNQIWSPATCAIQMTGNIPTGGTAATCTLLVGFMPASAAFVDATYQVTGATSGAIGGQVVNYGQQIFAVWANANASATITLTVNGTMTVPG
jgi:hypothetical protein